MANKIIVLSFRYILVLRDATLHLDYYSGYGRNRSKETLTAIKVPISMISVFLKIRAGF